MQEQDFDYSNFKKSHIKKPHLHISFFIILILVIILTIVAIVLTRNNKKSFEQKFYFVQINSYLRYSEATKTACEIQELGAGGYIYYNGKYFVFASCYPTKNEAQSVVDNLKSNFPTATIFELGIKKYSANKNFTTKQNSVVKSTLTSINNCLSAFYNTILSLDKNEISINQASLQLKTINDEASRTVNSFSETFPIYNNAYNGGIPSSVKNSLIYLNNINDIFSLLEETVNQNNYSSNLKNYLMKAAFYYSSFASLV